MAEWKAQVFGARALADDDVEHIIFHGGIQHLFHRMVEAVDLVDEEHVALVEVGEDGGEVAPALDGGAGRETDLHPQFGGDDVRQRGLAEAGRAVQQDVVERLPAHFGGGDVDGQILFDLFLPDVVGHGFGAQGVFFRVVLPFCAHDEAVLVERAEIVHRYVLIVNLRFCKSCLSAFMRGIVLRIRQIFRLNRVKIQTGPQKRRAFYMERRADMTISSMPEAPFSTAPLTARTLSARV